MPEPKANGPGKAHLHPFPMPPSAAMKKKLLPMKNMLTPPIIGIIFIFFVSFLTLLFLFHPKAQKMPTPPPFPSRKISWKSPQS
jgi:hypothetical protein